MTTLVETSERVGAWLYQRLAGDASLASLVSGRIYRNVAPQGTAYPLITFSPQSVQDLNTLSGTHVKDEQLWLVKVCWQGDSQLPGKAIADRVFQLLHGYGPTTLDGVQILKAVRQAVIPQPTEYIGGVRHESINHQYRVGTYIAT